MIVLDASVVAKWFKEEETREIALKVRENFKEGKEDIAIPDLLLLELANLLKHSGIFKKEDVFKALQSIDDLNLTIIVPTTELIKKASNLAFESNITVYDALYLATAKDLGCQFITADEKLYENIKDLDYVKLLKDLEGKGE